MPAKKTKTDDKKTTKVSTKKTDATAVVAPAPSEDKLKIIEEFATKQGDTGSPEVQVALLTTRILKLVDHLKENSSDNHSRKGLLGMISKRRRLLNYLKERDNTRYKELSKRLQLK